MSSACAQHALQGLPPARAALEPAPRPGQPARQDEGSPRPRQDQGRPWPELRRAAGVCTARRHARMMVASSLSVHVSCLMSGSIWLHQRSRHCLPLRPCTASAIADQRFGPTWSGSRLPLGLGIGLRSGLMLDQRCGPTSITARLSMSSSSAVHGWLARRPLGSPLAPSRPPSLYKPPSWPRASGRFGAREVLALVLSSGPVDVADPSDTGGLGVLALVARLRLLPFGGLRSRRSASASGAASATGGSKTSECRLRSGRDESTGYAASVEHSDPSLDGRWSTPTFACGSSSLHASGSWACPAAAAANTAASANPCPARAPSMRCGEHDISCASGRAERVWVQGHGNARRSGQALRTCVATGCEAANYEAQPAVQRWRSELPPRGYCRLLLRGRPLRLWVAGFWMPASARQQPTQRRRPAHTSSERRRSTLCRDPTHRNRHGEYLANILLYKCVPKLPRKTSASIAHRRACPIPCSGVSVSPKDLALPCNGLCSPSQAPPSTETLRVTVSRATLVTPHD